jgi:hypothetical protein
MKNKAPKTRDYFAEMYVAGILADSGWNIYFPKRDVGFDFIITKSTANELIIRPVQVKGKYPETRKTNKKYYGFSGKLSQVHNEMALVIPFFSTDQSTSSPDLIAFMPYSQVKITTRGYKCAPASYQNGTAVERRDFKKFFGNSGIQLMELNDWKNENIG